MPNHCVNIVGNDIIIDEVKIGPTCAAGTVDWSGKTTIQNSGCIYLLRWAHPEKLDKIFAGDPNHLKRKVSGKRPIGALNYFIKELSRQEFIAYLEAFE